MIKYSLNEKELGYISSHNDVIQNELQDVLDLLPSDLWFGDENNGFQYELNIMPYSRTGDCSTWTVAYLAKDDDGAIPCIVTFSSNDGLLVPAFKMYMWIKKYTHNSEHFKVIDESLSVRKNMFDAMNNVDKEYKLL